MFRVLVGVLAAFVGFSFGHSIPKWMENKSKSATEMQGPASSECAHPARKLLLRRKSLRKFKFSSQKPGKENLEVGESHQQLSKDIVVRTGPLECSPTSPLCTSSQDHAQHKKFKFGSQKLLKEKANNESSFECIDSSSALPLSAANVDNKSHLHRNASTNAHDVHRSHRDTSTDVAEGCRESCAKSQKNGQPLKQEVHAESGSPAKVKLEEPVFCKISSTQSTCGSLVKEKSQMKQWKTKLMNLRSRAMVSEKVWYEKFESEKFSRKLLVPSSLKGVAKRQAKGKENESPQLPSTNRRELSWSRSSSSNVGLLVEDPRSSFER